MSVRVRPRAPATRLKCSYVCLVTRQIGKTVDGGTDHNICRYVGMADEVDSKSIAEKRAGSSPATDTIYLKIKLKEE